ncbi:MAG: Penicillin-binding protein 4* [Peptostreptococcus russellii]
MDKIDKKLKKFSGTILISIDDKIVLNRAYDYKNIEDKVENKPDTRFAIGSISKMFTAIAIMKLYEEEKLDIDESVNKYLKIDNLEDSLKIRHLLSHTSGLKNFVLCRKEFDLYEDNKAEDIVNKIVSMKRNYQNGSKFSYNNTGYLMLALIIEKVSKMSFQDYITKNIFLKLDMKDSSFLSKDRKNIACPYRKDILSKVPHPSVFFGCGDIVSTSIDLSKFISGINTGKIISKNLLDEMKKTHGKNIFVNYGYGFMIEDKSEKKSFGHSGSIPNSYASKLTYYEKEKILIVVLSNNIKKINFYIPSIMSVQSIEKYLYKITSRKLI